MEFGQTLKMPVRAAGGRCRPGAGAPEDQGGPAGKKTQDRRNPGPPPAAPETPPRTSSAPHRAGAGDASDHPTDSQKTASPCCVCRVIRLPPPLQKKE